MTHLKFLLILCFAGLFVSQNMSAGRYYNAAIGRFLQVDPLADKYPGWTPYNYTLNNPIAYIDPDGNAPFRFGKEISYEKAKELTLSTIQTVLSNGGKEGKRPGIDFIGKATWSDTWKSIKEDGLIPGLLGGKDYSPAVLKLGEEIDGNQFLGRNQQLNTLKVNTEFAFTEINQSSVERVGQNSSGNELFQLSFGNTGNVSPTIILNGTLEQINETLKSTGYGLTATSKISRYKLIDGKKIPVYYVQWDFIKLDTTNEDEDTE